MNTSTPRTLRIRTSSLNGFTLVELLVVIMLIAVLAGLSITGVGTIRKKAKVQEAKEAMMALSQSVEEYYTEYNRLPLSSTGDLTEDDPALQTDQAQSIEVIQELLGEGDPDTTQNFKERRFLRIKETTDNKNGLNRSDAGIVTGIYDPWGNGYFMRFDTNHDGSIEFPAGSDSSWGTHLSGSRILLYSYGPDGVASEDDVYSWVKSTPKLQ